MYQKTKGEHIMKANIKKIKKNIGNILGSNQGFHCQDLAVGLLKLFIDILCTTEAGRFP